ncbi:MAG: hypothetical protein ACRBN8_28985 [Nannocystales bacterium]
MKLNLVNRDDWEFRRLLERTADLGIAGRDQVVAEKANKPGSTGSELLIAALLARTGLTVRMLVDRDPRYLEAREAKRGGVSLPDLHVQCEASGLEFFVEVRRLSDGTVPFSRRLGVALADAGLMKFRVCAVPLGAAAWAPGADYESRRAQERLVDELIARVVEHLQDAQRNGTDSGTFEVQMPATAAHPEKGDNFHRFSFGPVGASVSDAEARRGALSGSGYTAIRWIGGDGIRDFVLRAIKHKVEQQQRHARQVQGVPYIVALDSHEDELDPTDISGQLVGGLLHVDEGVHYRRWPYGSLDPLRGTAWEVLHEVWNLRESDMLQRVMQEGRSMVENVSLPEFIQPWTRSLSGVFALHRKRDVVQFMPNPWAVAGYNEPRLLGLSLDESPEGRSESSWRELT